MDKIDIALKNKNIDIVFQECKTYNLHNIGKLLSFIFNRDYDDLFTIKLFTIKLFTIKLLCNWTSSEELTQIWKKMSKDNLGTWDNIKLTDNNPDYFVVINATNLELTEEQKKRTILFQMEPKMKENKMWGIWSNPKKDDFLAVFTHENSYNNIEWHISKTYTELKTQTIQKTENVLSVIQSEKYTDPGQIKRIDFVKYLDNNNFTVHVFGSNKWGYKNYKGSLPYHNKDNGLLPYKYTLAVENNSIPNYFTEKIIDAILSESLCFYNGCFNLKEYINENAFVYIELANFENDMNIIKKAIEEDWYTKRLPYIRLAKQKILDELQFFPRISDFINKITQQ